MDIQKILSLPSDKTYHTEISDLPGFEGVPILVMDPMIITDSSPDIWYMDAKSGLYYKIDKNGRKTKFQKDITHPNIFIQLFSLVAIAWKGFMRLIRQR